MSDQPALGTPASRESTHPFTRVVRWTLGAGLVGVASVLLLNQLVSRTDTTTVPLNKAITKVDIVVDHGNINVTAATSASDKAQLERRLTRSLRDPEERVEQHGATLTVYASCGRRLTGDCSTDYQLTVPRNTQVQVRTEVGAVTVKGLRAPLAARTKVGDVRVADVRGRRLTALSQTGNVTLSEVRFDRARARTERGDVRVVTADGFHQLQASSETGDVVVTLPDEAGPYAVKAGTDEGARQVDVGQDAAATATVDVTTAIGDVTVSKV